ncbi:type I phosphodiesterase/nucleotide pyrophosphatase [Beutenbergia cavernae DSM 12333]|uniref:Type I phosphodiesterase/nucleotide pyrophosphatase n=1 Tax=Beutenbergia cavernae (strain ATCC BAA-8 / DSM 12333 / CCUG 43141 / JCM 11478 / NBRC 16432 / NCIMB 13614 / HKI 0122) TaxID=471853 RepID=C5C0N5_BEUC1|nr:alkaline phosphatase family protein [Beutenbergia cavernae]ACQ81431.1 type I phosphodiesterase/nucleotide pyrophosphatase [Beutenbergia cavernae DSM 12333]
MRQHVLVLALDGVHAGILATCATPHLDGVAARGFARDIRIREGEPTISGPIWTSAMTGVPSATHGVRDNDLSRYTRREHPDVATILGDADPGLRTLVAAHWAPLVTGASGGPLFATGGYWPGDVGGVDAADERVTRHACDRLAAEDVAFAFVYFHLVDAVGHDVGTGEPYRAAIETTDARVGRVLDAVASRPSRGREEWTVIALTDHGHRPEGGHGGRSDDERAAWIRACGPGLREAAVRRDLTHEDVAAQALVTLGLPLPDQITGRALTACPTQRAAATRPTTQEDAT